MSTHPEALETALSIWRETVRPVAERQRVSLLEEPVLRAPPFVLLLGNHSSGKSSLVNHLLGQDIQRTGVAPTDDGFTVLFHGEGEPLDGDALTARPDLPFRGLRKFGPGLLRHLKGRPVASPLLQQVWLVDSPGMIDTGSEQANRPYDFEAVVRALAEQADLVLLLFDPEKPGTTGETLTVLARSLSGLEDRLRVVMNKMDLFVDLRDFARAYGALCWNLSRVLKRQDVPHIYTTALPGKGGLSPESFAAALGELKGDVEALPARRRDSLLNRMRSEARRIWLRATVLEAARDEVSAVARRGVMAGAALTGLCAGGWAISRILAKPEAMWGVHVFWLALLGVALYGTWLAGRRWRRQAVDRAPGRLEVVFREHFRERLALGDAELEAAWAAAGPDLARHVATVGLDAFAKVGRKALSRLAHAVEVALPAAHEAAAQAALPAPEGTPATPAEEPSAPA
ncbi:MAG: dynamin family protein [Myxococcales bacterium]|nr:dynamin family protein [Myxococcales bacterium]MCB9522187.1 dynamin family protein [Myxococcales bacterium]